MANGSVFDLRLEAPIALTIALALVVTAARAQPPSFDCSKAKKQSEQEICRDPALADLDRELAQVYAAATASGKIADIKTAQRNWVNQRNRCGSNAVCLSQSISGRIGDLRQPSDVPVHAESARPFVSLEDGAIPRNASGQNRPDGVMDTASAETARRWGVPTLNGIPYLPRAGELGPNASTYGTSIDNTIGLVAMGSTIGEMSGLSSYAVQQAAPPAVRAWTRTVYAMGLAASPDAVAKLDDVSLVGFACVLLSVESQKALTGGKSCQDIDHSSDSAGIEFERHDLATAFKTDKLPSFIQAAPRLPFRMMISRAIALPRYDLANEQFTIHSYSDSSSGPAIFGANVNLDVHELVWKVPEREARAIVTAKSASADHNVYLAITMTITGTIDTGQVGFARFSTNSGLPFGKSWRIEGGDVVLYDDPGLTKRLHAFTDLPRIPLPIAGTLEAETPRAYGPVTLDGETAMLLLLHAGLLNDKEVTWPLLASNEYEKQQRIASNIDWERYNPWGLFFPTSPNSQPNLVEEYRAWSVRRASALPATAVMHIGTSANVEQSVTVFDGMTGRSELGDPDTATRIKAALAKQGLSEANLLPLDLRFPGAENRVILAAVPQPVASIKVILVATPARTRVDHEAQTRPSLDFELAFDGVEQLPGHAILLRFRPQRVTLVRDAAAVATAELPAAPWPMPPPPQAAPPKPLTALERLANGPYGPDVVGLRLGMPMTTAEATVRGEMQVGKTLETLAPVAGQEQPPAWLHGRLFIAADGKERIALFEGAGAQAGRVVGVWRRMFVPRNAHINEQVVEAMEKKYGPATTKGSSPVWNARPITDYHCRTGREASWENWKENGKSARQGYAVYNEVPQLQTVYPTHGEAPQDYDICGPVLTVTVGNNGSGYTPGVVDIPVNVSLLDLGIMAQLEKQPSALPIFQPPPMKF